MSIDAPELTVSVTENSVVIEFEAVPYAKTEIYRNGNLIKTVYNTTGKQIVVDDFIPNEKTYYSAKHIVKNLKTDSEIESELSEPKIVYVKAQSISESELNEIDNYTNVFDDNEKKPISKGFDLIKKFFKV